MLGGAEFGAGQVKLVEEKGVLGGGWGLREGRGVERWGGED